MVRGGGRIVLRGSQSVTLHGTLEANGGHCTVDSTGAGSGGTVVLQAINLSGSGSIHAVGGNSFPYTSGILDSGGGGAGGGGRYAAANI